MIKSEIDLSLTHYELGLKKVDQLNGPGMGSKRMSGCSPSLYESGPSLVHCLPLTGNVESHVSYAFGRYVRGCFFGSASLNLIISNFDRRPLELLNFVLLL